jgi:hypothetical protein
MKFYIFRVLYLLRLLYPAGRTLLRALIEDRDEFELTLENLKTEAFMDPLRRHRFVAFHDFNSFGHRKGGFEDIEIIDNIPGAANVFVKKEISLKEFVLDDVKTVSSVYVEHSEDSI